MKKNVLIKVLNAIAALIILGVVIVSILNLIDLRASYLASQSMIQWYGVTVAAWTTNLCLTLPMVLALSLFTLKYDTREMVFTSCFLLGMGITGYYSLILIGACLSTGAYFKMMFWILCTVEVAILFFLLLRCGSAIKEICLDKIKAKFNSATLSLT